MLNLDQSCSYLGLEGDVYVWMTSEGAEAASKNNLSVACTNHAAGPPIQKRSVKYMAIVNALSYVKAMVTYVKDNSFEPSRVDCFLLAEIAGVQYYAILLGTGEGVMRRAADKMMNEIVAPLMRSAEVTSRKPPAVAQHLGPSGIASTTASARTSSSNTIHTTLPTNAAALPVHSDSSDDEIGREDDRSTANRATTTTNAITTTTTPATRPSSFHRPVLLLDGEQDQIGSLTHQRAQLPGDQLKTAAECSLSEQPLDLTKSFLCTHTFFDSEPWKNLLRLPDAQVPGNELTEAIAPHLTGIDPPSQRIFLRFFSGIQVYADEQDFSR